MLVTRSLCGRVLICAICGCRFFGSAIFNKQLAGMETAAAPQTLPGRVARVDWLRIERELDEHGWSRLGPVLGARDCDALERGYADDTLYRATIDMERYRFGRGQYRY